MFLMKFFRKHNRQIKSAINSLQYLTLYQQQNHYDYIMNIPYIAQPYWQQQIFFTVYPLSLFQTVTLVRPGTDSSQPAQRLLSSSLSNPAMSPAPLTSPSSLSSPHPSVPVRTPSTGPSLSPAAQSKLATTNGTTGLKMSSLGQSPLGQNSQECSQDKQAEQAKLVRTLRLE